MFKGSVMWDHDGVISDWVGNFYPWLCAKEGWEQSTWEIWHHYRNHGMQDEHFVARLKEYATEGGFGDQKIYDGVATTVSLLKRAGYTQHVVTDRPAAAEADTAWWMDTYLPDIDTLTFGRDKTVFKEFSDGPYYAIDDRVENVQALIDADIEAYLMDRPWNRDSSLPRVGNVYEFLAILVSPEKSEIGRRGLVLA